MIQCQDCEYFSRGPDGEIAFGCDPFANIKEAECLAKWQLIKTNQMVAAYQATLDYYHRLAPLQERMFKVMEHELDGMDESDKWKVHDDDYDGVDDEQADDDGWKDPGEGP